jgi:hypothetical protein
MRNASFQLSKSKTPGNAGAKQKPFRDAVRMDGTQETDRTVNVARVNSERCPRDLTRCFTSRAATDKQNRLKRFPNALRNVSQQTDVE